MPGEEHKIIACPAEKFQPGLLLILVFNIPVDYPACLRKMCLEAAEYCVWGEQWLAPGSSPPADLSCQVSALILSFLPAPKALQAPNSAGG